MLFTGSLHDMAMLPWQVPTCMTVQRLCLVDLNLLGMPQTIHSLGLVVGKVVVLHGGCTKLLATLYCNIYYYDGINECPAKKFVQQKFHRIIHF